MKTLFSALFALGLLAGVANAADTTVGYGCGYGHLKAEATETVGYGCGYGHNKAEAAETVGYGCGYGH
jgi:hypothetical protein